MRIHKLIIHELQKESGSNETELVLSDELINISDRSSELLSSLLESYNSDRIQYANFRDTPDSYFPSRYDEYNNSDREPEDFIDFTVNVLENLERLISPVTLAKGGYLLFAEYDSNGIDFISIFLIRDTEGKRLERVGNSYSIESIEYLNTNDLAMACRINENKILLEEDNHLSFTNLRQQEISDYFINWICATSLESSREYTNSLYEIINALPTPTNPDTNLAYSIDEVRNMVYENARNNAQRSINLQSLGAQIYGDSNIIVNYAEENDISIDTEFRFHKRAIKRFIQLHVNRDGINMKLSRGDFGSKVRLSIDNENLVLIESQSFANALRNEINNNE